MVDPNPRHSLVSLTFYSLLTFLHAGGAAASCELAQAQAGKDRTTGNCLLALHTNVVKAAEFGLESDAESHLQPVDGNSTGPHAEDNNQSVDGIGLEPHAEDNHQSATAAPEKANNTEEGRVVAQPPKFMRSTLDYLAPVAHDSPVIRHWREAAANASHRLSIAAEGGLVVLLLILMGTGMYLFLSERQLWKAHKRPDFAGQRRPGIVRLWAHYCKCDYVMVFPLRGEAKRNLHLSGTRLMLLSWGTKVNGRELARKVFLDPCKQHVVTEDDIDRRFQEVMTQEAYCKATCDLLMEALTGVHFGLKVEAFPSRDHDEVYLTLTLGQETLEQYAAMLRYRMPVSDVAYGKEGVPVPKNSHDEEVRAIRTYVPNTADLFMPFKSSDRLRLLSIRLGRFLDLTQLSDQGVLAEHFGAHDLTELDILCANWANPRLWYRVPERDLEDRVRAYFGEEAAWIFVWQRFFGVALLVPALMGLILFFRRFVLSVDHQRQLQMCFAFAMSLWATVLNSMWARYEAVVRQRWGMEKSEATVQIRDEYDANLDRSWRVRLAMVLGDVLAIGMVLLCIMGIRMIQGMREHMIANHSHSVWQQVSAGMVACQILVLDMIWRLISKQLVDLENHKTAMQWQRSWVQKVFLVRIFNNLYPFLYVGFLKQYSYQGCPATQTGCIGELERYLLTYFVSRFVIHLATDIYYVLVARAQMWLESWRAVGEYHHPELQVQAKSQDYNLVMKLDDWTENVLTFLFLACFNVVLPVISFLALLTTLMEARTVAHRNCCFLRRPVPVSAAGIGEWHRIMEGAEFLAVLVNVGFAVFVMRPLGDLPRLHKFALFVVVEHLIIFAKYLLKVKFPEVPEDVEDVEHVNEDVLRKTTAMFQQHQTKVVSITREDIPAEADIGPRAFGGRK